MVPKKTLRELIPWYLNGTLNEEERLAVEEFINNDPDGIAAFNEWSQVKSYVRDQQWNNPPADLNERIISIYSIRSRESLKLIHPYALGLAIVILSILWIVLRPGIILQWSITGTDVTSFRVFRSDQGDEKYLLLDEIPATENSTSYSYVDILFIPFKTYEYYVESINQDESLGISQEVIGYAKGALPGQIALILISVGSSYGIILLIKNRRSLLMKDR